MNALGLLFVLIVNICFALSSVFFKLAAGRFTLTGYSIGQLVSATLIFVTSWYCWLGAGAATAGTVVYVMLLNRFNLSYIYPMLSLAYIFVALAGMLFLKETISLAGWVGIAFICLGVALISVKPA
jgi:uncharacterized membrane protein